MTDEQLAATRSCAQRGCPQDPGNGREIEQRTGRHIPTLAIAAHALTGDRGRCLAAGMDSYLSRPIRLNDLLHAIDELVPVATVATL